MADDLFTEMFRSELPATLRQYLAADQNVIFRIPEASPEVGELVVWNDGDELTAVARSHCFVRHFPTCGRSNGFVLHSEKSATTISRPGTSSACRQRSKCSSHLQRQSSGSRPLLQIACGFVSSMKGTTWSREAGGSRIRGMVDPG
jgi:hypothetical protein